MKTEDLNQIRRTISLLSSIVQGGEVHSDYSQKMVTKSLETLTPPGGGIGEDKISGAVDSSILNRFGPPSPSSNTSIRWEHGLGFERGVRWALEEVGDGQGVQESVHDAVNDGVNDAVNDGVNDAVISTKITLPRDFKRGEEIDFHIHMETP